MSIRNLILNQDGLPGITKDGISRPRHHHAWIDLNLLAAATHSRPIYRWAKVFMLLHFQEITGKGYASKPEAR